MDITDQIINLTEAVKALPNSLARNKVMSHLHDARVWSQELKPKSTDEPKAECTCPVGGIRADCPVHGN